MKTSLWLLVVLLLCGSLTVPLTAVTAPAPPAKTSAATALPSPGIEMAQALSMITGVAISPLVGVSAVGAWKYFATPSQHRAQLPWYAQPWFWIPALLLVTACFAKDTLGVTVPTALKKPFDIAELFENKLSALVAAGAFVPLVASVFHSVAPADSSSFSTVGLAAIDPSPLYNLVAVPVALGAFVVVWLVAHATHVLIVLSPFTTVDSALKGVRLALLGTVPLTSWLHPYFGAAWALVLIVLSYFLAGWSLRMMVFGSVFAWDFLSLGRKRCTPDRAANWMFTARELNQVPIRTYGKLRRTDAGLLTLEYRPWLFLPRRTLNFPAGQYAIGRGLFHPDLLRLDGDAPQSVGKLPPRYCTHEAALTEIYQLAPIQDVGLSAMWKWLKELCGWRPAPVTDAAA